MASRSSGCFFWLSTQEELQISSCNNTPNRIMAKERCFSGQKKTERNCGSIFCTKCKARQKEMKLFQEVLVLSALPLFRSFWLKKLIFLPQNFEALFLAPVVTKYWPSWLISAPWTTRTCRLIQKSKTKIF